MVRFHSFYTSHSAALRGVVLFSLTSLFCCFPELHSQTTRGDNNGSAIFGQVTQSGVPVASADVKAYEEVSKNGHLYLEAKCASQTNEAGKYLCGGLTGGRYYLFVQTQNKSLHSPFAPAFVLYYQTLTLADAELVSVREGQSQVIQIELGNHLAYTVAGELVARPRSPSLSLHTLGRHGESISTRLIPSYDSASGAFSFKGVPPGQYSLLAFWHDAEREHSDEVAVTVTDQDVVDLQVQDAGTVHLVFEVQPCEAAAEAIRALYLSRADGHLTDGAQVAPVSPGTTNRFDFRTVPAGKYFVDVVGIAGGYIAETSLAPDGFSRNLISIPDGGGSITVQAQVGCEASKLAGRVDGEDGANGQALVVLRSSLTGETFQRITTHGSFTFNGVAPGDYSVYAVPANSQNNHQNESSVDETIGTSVILDPNRTADIVVPLSE